ncbi:hypothetical protein JCM3775_006841 [Rhodotorula graminis]
MSGISFKISAPSRPSTASAPPTRPSSGAGHHRRAAPGSARHGDSSDEDGEGADGAQGRGQGSRKRARLDQDGEEVVEFGAGGAKSKHAKAAPAGPLVIPALPNKDWRQAAEQMRAGRPGAGGRTKKQLYLPETGGGMSMTSRIEGAPPPNASAAAELADQINAAPVVGGLEQPVRRARDGEGEGAAAPADAAPPPPPPPVEARAPMTDEQRALRELLGSAEGGAGEQEQELAAIYSGPDARTGPTDEGDAFKQDVSSRPDQSTLDDYARVPVGQFGLAMLRGMGWQPGQPASRSGRAGPTEAYVPAARPHMLGIGAKPMAEAMGGAGGAAGGSGGKGGKKDQPRRMGRDEMRFVPLLKQARASGGESTSGSGRSTPLPLPSTDRNGSGPSSRRTSRSPPPSSSRRDRDRDYERDRGSSRRDRDDERSSSRRDRDRDEGRSSSRRERERDEPRDGHRERERERERGSSTRERDYERRDERRERDRGDRRDRERR